MAKYKLIIKKEGIELDLETNDKEFVERELGSWIVMASVALESPKSSSIADIESGETATKSKLQSLEDETKEILQKAIHSDSHSEKEEVASELSDEEPMEVVDDFSSVLKEKVQETTSKMSELPIPPEIPAKPSAPQQASGGNTIDKFADIVSSKKINNAFDCLIACAYHLVERENFERFTLKQVNTLSKALVKDPIEHDTVKEAMDRKLIKIVPDYTGVSDIIEYTLTNAGIGYFKDELE